MLPLRQSSIALALCLLLACRARPHAALFEGPTVVTRLELHDRHNQVLWRIDAVTHEPVQLVEYGSVPPGFKQTVPGRGRPRPLHPGEPLLLIYAMPSGWTRHSGHANAADSYSGGGRLSGPWCGTTAAEVFAEGLSSIEDLPAPNTHPCP